MLPTTLTQFGAELECAIARELETPAPPLRHRPPRRRRMLAGAVACVAVGAAAVAIVAAGGGSANSAWDLHVLRAAEIELPKPAASTILHVSVTQTTTPSARGNSALLVPTVEAEGWFQQGPPWHSVTREQVPGHPPTWQTGQRVYDPTTKRVYVAPLLPSGRPRFTLTKHGRDGVITLQIATSYGPVRETVSAPEARALRTGADGILWIAGWNGHKLIVEADVMPRAQSSNASLAEQPNSTSLTFPAQLQRLLQSGHARVAGRVTVDGRTAIKIAISGVSGYQRMTYYVDPTTYRPIELDKYGFGDPKNVTRLVFHVYQQLPIKGNAQLLRLHTSAGTSVDHSPAGYFRHIPALVFW